MRNLLFENKLNVPETLLPYYRLSNNKENNNNNNNNNKKKKKNKNKQQNNNNSNNTQQVSVLENNFSFKDIYPENWQKRKTQLVKSIQFSGWNPAMEYRKLAGLFHSKIKDHFFFSFFFYKGDLFYFVVTTNEGRRIHFTACDQGFFANKSDDVKFNPEPYLEDRKIFHLLIDCFCDSLVNFQQKFSKYLLELNDTFENDSIRTNQWIAPLQAPTYSVAQGDTYIESFHITETPGVMREWNVEFQSCKELPETTNEETIRKYAIWYKSSTEFINASIDAAKLLVDGDISPVNGEDPVPEQIYIYNNIFLTRALDNKEQMLELGGERSVRKLFTNEILSQSMFNSLNVPNLYTLAMTIIDYRGQRIIAQSLLPGIFLSETTSDVKYGSVDFGNELKYNEDFVEPLKELVKFGLTPHEFTDKSGNKKTIYTAAETKMLVGTDGRKYLLVKFLFIFEISYLTLFF